MAGSSGFDPVWERAYLAGFMQRWPWDSVVSFVFRHAPRDRARADVKILELGCGACSNLWFAAKEGFSVAGIDGSDHAISRGKDRLAEEGLTGDLQVGDFTAPLPFTDVAFDLVIDRASLTCVGFTAVRRVVDEALRVLRPGGYFLFTPYGAEHPGAKSGRAVGDGLVTDIKESGLANLGAISFWGESDVRAAFDSRWRLISLGRLQQNDLINPQNSRDEWYVVAQKT